MLNGDISAEDFVNFLSVGAVLSYERKYYLSIGPLSSRHRVGALQFFSPNFFMNANLENISGTQSFMISQDHFIFRLNEYLKAKPVLLKAKWEEPQFEKYQQVFARIQGEIAAKKLKKMVPVLFAKTQLDMDLLRRAQILRNLSQGQANLYLYGQWDQSEGILGATPEILASAFSSKLKSMALAGTQIKEGGACRLLEDPKELYEHQLVVEDILEVLRDFGEAKVSPPGILELASLWHLKTEIHVKLKSKLNSSELIKRLHPTPALGVSPRNFNFQWMRQLPESDLRERFGAPFAVLLPNQDFVAVVAIRNIQWRGDQILLGAGGGVVYSSQLQKEWLELEAKRNAIKNMMGL